MKVNLLVRIKAILRDYKVIKRVATIGQTAIFGAMWMLIIHTIFDIPISLFSYLIGISFYFIYGEIIFDLKNLLGQYRQ